MNKIDISTYTPKSTDTFFFDNNVWMYLYCPLGNHNPRYQTIYSDLFGKIMSVGAKIYVSSLVLSEFYNSYSRLDFNIWRNGETKDFKRDYRPTQRFKDISQTIILSIESRILGIADRIDDEFSTMNIEDISAKCEELDFNDSYYVELVKKYDCKLVTNDRDFLNVSDSIDIITAQ